MKSQQSSDKPNTTGIGPDSDKQADLLLGIFIMSVCFQVFQLGDYWTELFGVQFYTTFLI